MPRVGDHFCTFRLPREEICHSREQLHTGIGQHAETACFFSGDCDRRQRGFGWPAILFALSHCSLLCRLSGCWFWILVIEDRSDLDDRRPAKKKREDIIRLSSTDAVDLSDVGAPLRRRRGFRFQLSGRPTRRPMVTTRGFVFGPTYKGIRTAPTTVRLNA